MIENPFEAPVPLSFPPLFDEQAVTGATDPFEKACALATLGCDSGVIIHNVTPDMLRAAIVFAPEVPLEQAMSVFCTCGVGFQNALGALAPPEVSVHLKWQGDIMVNGAISGRLRIAASSNDPLVEPDWLVMGLEVVLIPQSNENPGDTPDETSLYQEGCGGVSPLRLLESWSRHTLVWLNRTESDGPKALFEEWRGLAHGIGDDVMVNHDGEILTGTFVGIDEHFGMLLRHGSETSLIPLTSLLPETVTT